MQFTWDFNTATLVAILVQIVVTVSYMVKTNGTAKEALGIGKKALARADEAHEKIVVLGAALALHREHVASEYHDKAELRQMESRLAGLIKDTETRLTNSINSINGRLDERA